MTKFFSAAGLLIMAWACTPVPSGQPGSNRPGSYQASASNTNQPLRYENAVYDDRIKTVQLFPDDATTLSQLFPAVAPLGQSNALWLHFDLLANDYEAYRAKVVHCDRNWQPSRVSPVEYLPDFNEFLLTDYTVSFNAYSYPYVHYRLQMPQVKLSGNYLLYVYPEGYEDRPILSRRFMVFEESVPLQPKLTLAQGVQARREYQQLEARFNYSRLRDVMDPMNQFSLLARQNQRWDKTRALKPSAVWDVRREVEYRPFDLDNAFKGGNEFRFFDLRTVRARGQNVRRVQIDSGYVRADLEVDALRHTEAYGQRPDENGQFYIANAEQTEAAISSEYVQTYFYLKSGQLNFPLYVAGEFNGFSTIESSRMEYEPSFGGYIGKALLKQGLYNYLYVDGEGNQHLTEGNFSETENAYELFLYYQAPTSRYDRLVSYRRFTSR